MDYLTRVLTFLESYSRLGQRTLANGTWLIGHVPHVAPEAWLHLVFCPLSKQGIALAEASVGRPIPPEFVAFLQRCNGLSIFSDTLSIDGLRTSFVRTGDDVWQPFSIKTPNVDERPRRSKPSYLFIGGYKCDGSLVYIDAADGRVYRCKHTSAKPLNEWEHLEVMIESEVERLATLFDRDGHILDPDKPTTP